MEATTRISSKLKRSTLALAIAASLSATANAAVTFTELPDENWGGAIDVSNDGTVVYAGDYNLYKWTAQEGVSSLKSVVWGRVAGAFISGDGDTIGYTNVGVDSSLISQNDAVIFKNGVEQVVTSETLNTSNLFFPGVLSNNGKYLTGTIGGDAAFLNLETSAISTTEDTADINFVGVSGISNNGELKVLKAANGYAPLTYFQNGNAEPEFVDLAYSRGSSANGQVIYGQKRNCTEGETAGETLCTAIWHADTKKITEIGLFNPHSSTSDGSIITGNGWTDNLGPKVWDSFNGLRDLVDILGNHGIDISNWSDFRHLAISDDGSKIAGFALNPQGINKAFLVNIIPECTGF